jgi:hypothetical protein
VAKLVRHKPLLIFKLAVFRLSHTHVHGGASLNNEKVVTSARVVKKRALFFRTLIYADRVSRATMASPRATRIAACSSRGPLSCTREKIFAPTVQRIKNAHLQQANASVCGQKISLDPLSWRHMTAIWGKQDIVTYVTEHSFTNSRTHRKRAVVSLIKARIILTNRTKNESPPNQNRRNLPIWMSEWRSRVGKP